MHRVFAWVSIGVVLVGCGPVDEAMVMPVTDPTTVNLAAGSPTMLEFFEFS